MKNFKYGAMILASGAMLYVSPALAKDPSDQFCSFIRKTEDGKFTYQLKTGWSLYRAQKADGIIEYDEDVTGVTCLRGPNILVKEDLETLKQGKSIILADPKIGPSSLITYTIKDGVITWETKSKVSKKLRKKIEKSLSKLQAAL